MFLEYFWVINKNLFKILESFSIYYGTRSIRCFSELLVRCKEGKESFIKERSLVLYSVYFIGYFVQIF